MVSLGHYEIPGRVKNWNVPNTNRGSEDEDPALPFAERALRKAKRKKMPKRTYSDFSFISPTSNICEQLFRLCKISLGLLRKSMTPRNLEFLMFLHANRALWDVDTVAEAMRGTD